MRPVIVAALDACDAKSLAWEEASLRARRARANLVAVRTIADRIESTSLVLGVWDELQQRAKDLCGQAELDLVIARGDLTAELARTASADGADLIVVGADLWSAEELPHRVRYLVERTRCPVMVVRPSAATGVLVAGIDGGPAVHIAAALGDELTTRRQGFVFLVHCISPERPPSAPKLTTRARMQWLLSRHRLRGVAVAIDAAPGPGLVDTALDLDAELIVVGASWDGGLGPPRVGPIATHVLRHARTSVLVVPPPTMIRWPRCPRPVRARG